jgi:hypothetical protein
MLTIVEELKRGTMRQVGDSEQILQVTLSS